MCISICAAQSLLPTISVHPVDAVVKEGTTHILHCAATATSELKCHSYVAGAKMILFSPGGEIQIRWAHNGVLLEPTDPNRELLANNSLKITSVVASRTGWYACRASNNIGTITSRQALLQIACKLTVTL